MAARIDIVLSTLNGARHLPDLLASLAAQTDRDLRLIARDDGSADDTVAILREFAEAASFEVEVIEGGPPSGAVAGFNAALAVSDADWFMFCDQDDVWDADKVAMQRLCMTALETRLGARRPALVHSDMRVVDEALSEVAPSFWARAGLDPAAVDLSSLLLRNVVSGCAMMGNAALRAKMSPIPPEAMMHDWWAALTAAHKGHIERIDRPLVAYRRHTGNVTGLRDENAVASAVRAVRNARAELAAARANLARLQAQAQAFSRRFTGAEEAAVLAALPRQGWLTRRRILMAMGMTPARPLRFAAYMIVA